MSHIIELIRKRIIRLRRRIIPDSGSAIVQIARLNNNINRLRNRLRNRFQR